MGLLCHLDPIRLFGTGEKHADNQKDHGADHDLGGDARDLGMAIRRSSKFFVTNLSISSGLHPLRGSALLCYRSLKYPRKVFFSDPRMRPPNVMGESDGIDNTHEPSGKDDEYCYVVNGVIHFFYWMLKIIHRSQLLSAALSPAACFQTLLEKRWQENEAILLPSFSCQSLAYL